ncbi:hypothetical protein F4775DRAFT_484022 [Biscogniauxia sp. FL1348]|nr:hypothetical protein F4775DRAFT_484022 [Biscogniauxia sp. FL1348]
MMAVMSYATTADRPTTTSILVRPILSHSVLLSSPSHPHQRNYHRPNPLYSRPSHAAGRPSSGVRIAKRLLVRSFLATSDSASKASPLATHLECHGVPPPPSRQPALLHKHCCKGRHRSSLDTYFTARLSRLSGTIPSSWVALLVFGAPATLVLLFLFSLF